MSCGFIIILHNLSFISISIVAHAQSTRNTPRIRSIINQLNGRERVFGTFTSAQVGRFLKDLGFLAGKNQPIRPRALSRCPVQVCMASAAHSHTAQQLTRGHGTGEFSLPT